MKYKIEDNGACISVPKKLLMERLVEVDAVTLKVLICVLDNPDFTMDELCDKLDITRKRLTAALGYWEEAGAFTRTDKRQGKSAASKTETEGGCSVMDTV